MCSPNVEYVLTKTLIDFIEEHDTIGYDIIAELNKFDQYIAGNKNPYCNAINTAAKEAELPTVSNKDIVNNHNKIITTYADYTWNSEGQTLYKCKLCVKNSTETEEFVKIEDFLEHIQAVHAKSIEEEEQQYFADKKSEELWIGELERMKKLKYKQHSEEFLKEIDEILDVEEEDFDMNCILTSLDRHKTPNESDTQSEVSIDSGIETSLNSLSDNSLEATTHKEREPKKKKKRTSGQCDVCNRTFNDLYNLRIHKMIHTGEKPFQCEECGKRFRQFNKLKIHCITHTNEKPFKCDICGKGFRFRNYLSVHKRLHSGENPYKCKFCDEYFHSLHSRRLHTKLVHCETKTFTCPICAKVLTAQCYLTAHMKRHTNQRDFKCPTCCKCFFSQSQLKDHELVHTNLKPYQCDVCSARFQRKSNYTQHLKIHTGEKSYVCHICFKSFAQNAGLYGHMKSHAK
ncbi:hypothetical protein DOY81_001897 [Sarcophaga bullata]|nr:hypothetical protein DOY81_001897 [Sarcophaga bullata]